MSREIRQATANDVDAIASVLNEAEAWLRGRGMPMWLPEELLVERIQDEIDAGLYFVAETGGEVVGTIRFQLTDPEYWPDLAPDGSAFLHRLAVRRQVAGSGVASALLSWAADRARGLGRSYVRLDCELARPRLREFYERHGFRHHSDRQVGPFLVARYELPLQ